MIGKKLSKADKLVMLESLKSGILSSEGLKQLSDGSAEYLAKSKADADVFFYGSVIAFLTMFATGSKLVHADGMKEAPRFTAEEFIDAIDAEAREILLSTHPERFKDGKVLFAPEDEEFINIFRAGAGFKTLQL